MIKVSARLLISVAIYLLTATISVYATEVTLIENLKPGVINYNSQKKYNLKRMAANSKVCVEQTKYSVLRVMCNSDRVQDLEAELLAIRGLDPVKNACINNCTLYRKNLEKCLEERYELQCMENFFSEEIVKHQLIKKNLPKQEVNYRCGKSQKVKVFYYGSELPAAEVLIGKKKFTVYKYPQNKGKYFTNANAGCISCEATDYLIETDSGITFKTKDLNLECEKVPVLGVK